MRERRDIVELWKRGDARVLITLVAVEGSSYRRPGARLLIAANGEYAGAISGGCLEAEMIRQAQWKVRGGAAMERYSTLFDDTAELPYGLGCGGTVDVLLEPADAPEAAQLLDAMERSLAGETLLVETELPVAGSTLRRSIGKTISQAGRSVFRETLSPPQRLIVFGAGDDAKPLVSSAAALGWNIAVVDGRTHLARRERFPEAHCVLTSPDVLSIGALDAVAIMTHSYEQDREALTYCLPRMPRYLGLLGSRHRSALLLSEAAVKLGWELQRACSPVFAPMGLDLGGDGAEAIALATLAEMQACVEGKLGAPRRMSEAAVREQVELGGASRYLQTRCAL